MSTMLSASFPLPPNMGLSSDTLNAPSLTTAASTSRSSSRSVHTLKGNKPRADESDSEEDDSDGFMDVPVLPVRAQRQMGMGRRSGENLGRGGHGRAHGGMHGGRREYDRSADERSLQQEVEEANDFMTHTPTPSPILPSSASFTSSHSSHSSGSPYAPSYVAPSLSSRARSVHTAQRSSLSSSVYPLSTASSRSLASRRDSLSSSDTDSTLSSHAPPPTAPAFSPSTSISLPAPASPQTDTEPEAHPDDVAYRLRLLVQNTYYLPPAHRKPTREELSPGSPPLPLSPNGAKNNGPGTATGSLRDLLRLRSPSNPSTSPPPQQGGVRNARSQTFNRTAAARTAPFLTPPPSGPFSANSGFMASRRGSAMSNSGSTTTTTTLRTQVSAPQMRHEPELKGRVLVIREKVDDLPRAAREAGAQMRAREARRARARLVEGLGVDIERVPDTPMLIAATRERAECEVEHDPTEVVDVRPPPALMRAGRAVGLGIPGLGNGLEETNGEKEEGSSGEEEEEENYFSAEGEMGPGRSEDKLKIGADVGADVLAEVLPQTAPDMSLSASTSTDREREREREKERELDPEEAQWRRALLHQAVGLSLVDEASWKGESPSPAASPAPVMRKVSNRERERERERERMNGVSVGKGKGRDKDREKDRDREKQKDRSALPTLDDLRANGVRSPTPPSRPRPRATTSRTPHAPHVPDRSSSSTVSLAPEPPLPPPPRRRAVRRAASTPLMGKERRSEEFGLEEEGGKVSPLPPKRPAPRMPLPPLPPSAGSTSTARPHAYATALFPAHYSSSPSSDSRNLRVPPSPSSHYSHSASSSHNTYSSASAAEDTEAYAPPSTAGSHLSIPKSAFGAPPTPEPPRSAGRKAAPAPLNLSPRHSREREEDSDVDPHMSRTPRGLGIEQNGNRKGGFFDEVVYGSGKRVERRAESPALSVDTSEIGARTATASPVSSIPRSSMSTSTHSSASATPRHPLSPTIPAPPDPYALLDRRLPLTNTPPSPRPASPARSFFSKFKRDPSSTAAAKRAHIPGSTFELLKHQHALPPTAAPFLAAMSPDPSALAAPLTPRSPHPPYSPSVSSGGSATSHGTGGASAAAAWSRQQQSEDPAVRQLDGQIAQHLDAERERMRRIAENLAARTAAKAGS